MVAAVTGAREPLTVCPTELEGVVGHNGRRFRLGVTDPERFVNVPRSRCAELAIVIAMCLVVSSVTLWIVVSMLLPLLWSLQYAYQYSYLLSVLGLFALLCACYVFQIGWGAFKWSRRYMATADIDWYSEWRRHKDADADGRVLDWHQVQHFVIVTQYKEPLAVLRQLAYTLMSQRVPRFCQNQITLVLACEEREGPSAHETARVLSSELGRYFRDVLATFHPSNLPGDIKGKASNYRWAAGEVERYIQQRTNLREEDCIIHVADADSLFDPGHFPYVNFRFCTEQARHHLVWQPCMIPSCNIWDVPPPNRQLSALVSAQEMMSAIDSRDFQIPFSTYGLALKTLQLIGGTGSAGDAQDGDVIAEDHHLFIRAFFATEGRMRLDPIFLPCLNFSVGGEAKSLWANLYDRFVQAKRHMFGVAELVYFLVLFFRLCGGRYKMNMGWRGWMRTLHLAMKLFKIHFISYLTFWVTLGLILVALLKLNKTACQAYQSEAPLYCDHALTDTTESIGVAIFTMTSTLSFIGSMFVIVSFVRMLKATQHTLINIGDPHGSFMGPAVWNQSFGADDDRSRCDRLRRPVAMSSGFPWCGAVTQLMVEFAVFGFITSVFFGTVPCVNALWHLIRHGHTLEYVAAHGAGVGGAGRSGSLSASACPSTTTSVNGIALMAGADGSTNGRCDDTVTKCSTTPREVTASTSYCTQTSSSPPFRMS